MNQKKIAELSHLSDPEDDVCFIDDLIETFFEVGGNLIAEIRRESEQKNYENLSRLAHKLKGCSANMGAECIAEIAAQIDDLSSDLSNQNFEGKDLLRLEALCNSLPTVFLSTKEGLIADWYKKSG